MCYHHKISSDLVFFEKWLSGKSKQSGRSQFNFWELGNAYFSLLWLLRSETQKDTFYCLKCLGLPGRYSPAVFGYISHPKFKERIGSSLCLIPEKWKFLVLLLGSRGEGPANHLPNYTSNLCFPLRKYSVSFVQPTPIERKLIETHQFSFHWIFDYFISPFNSSNFCLFWRDVT